MRITHEELVPLAEPILLQFEQVVENFMREREEGDRSIFTAYDLEYHPCLLWKAASTVAMRYTAKGRLPAAHVWITPRNLLQAIVEI
jgi:hypothetical protein